MSILQLIVILALVGFVLWAINTYVPMAAGVKKLLNLAVIFILILWLLKVFGLLGSLSSATI